MRSNVLLLLLLIIFAVVIQKAVAIPQSLSFTQRRQFLRYYAPLLFKRCDESSSRPGYDWVTNFDFDSDKLFYNNKDNWEKLEDFVDGSDYEDWQIRPTMYTAMIEYMSPNGSRKDATLLYHVYHAKQTGSIHDWERVEVRLTDISGNPGSGEDVSYVVLTEHKKHNVRLDPHGDLNFFTTANGKHPMVWQAQQRKKKSDSIIGFFGGFVGHEKFQGGELHFVEEPMSKITDLVNDDDKAEVDVNGGDKKNFHYLFVPQDDVEAVSYWNAQTLTQSNADELSHKHDKGGIKVSEVRKIKYELQDLADILPTHWSEGRYAGHWTKGAVARILLETSLAPGVDEGPGVPAGMQTFYARSKDLEDDDEDRRGYPLKSWFWGAYKIGEDKGSMVSASRRDPDRGRANGDPESVENEYWYQHDFFVHDGPRGVGRWLERGWHRRENGGFDGRWVQLFPN